MKLRKVLARPGMYIDECSLTYAIAFVSGVGYGQEPSPLAGFRDWLIKNYFNRRQSQTWEFLVEKIPQCSTGDKKSDVQAFLSIVGEYLDTLDIA